MKDITKKRGVVEFSRHILDMLDVDDFKLIFSNIYPINITLEQFDRHFYYCYSEHFDKTEEGCIVPRYEIIIETDKNHNKTISFNKI